MNNPVSNENPHRTRSVAVIGGGPAGLMAAEILSATSVAVTVYDRMPNVGRKFLMAGRGGLNLTHSEDLARFVASYGDAAEWVKPFLDAFSPTQLRLWASELGEETFVGSSGRVFPASLKASPLLREWLRRLDTQGVTLATRRDWIGWNDDGALMFRTRDGEMETVTPDATILALGGGSWPRLGATGDWVNLLRRRVTVSPLKPANCGFSVAWSTLFRERFAGEPLKNAAFEFGGHKIRGEAMITDYGVEGGAIYALSASLRNAIETTGAATLQIDLRPDLSPAVLTGMLQKPRQRQSLANHLRKHASLSPLAVNLLREANGLTLPDDAPSLAALIKSVSLTLLSPQPLATAISSAGGIAREELDEHLMLRVLPGVFAAGEMLDWEAPTGGYLLQACFATGHAAARGVIGWLALSGRAP